MCLVVSGVKMESAEKCTDLTVSIKLLQGENDNKLEWPIGHKYHCGTQPPWPALSFVYQVYIHMCGLKQLETRNDYYKTLKSPILVNDCLTLNV